MAKDISKVLIGFGTIAFGLLNGIPLDEFVLTPVGITLIIDGLD